MCGIAGFIDKKNQLNKKTKYRLLGDMLKEIEHRGRDGVGVFVDEKVSIGHCRLSIMDVSSAGSQPFLSSNNDKILSYNGEIYNYLELNNVLKKDFNFKSSCDTETLMHAFEKWGIKSLSRFKGMYAFSLYDKKDNTIYLAVDRFGIKPLYYFNNKDFFVFSSEIKAILKFLNKKIYLNKDVLGEYLLYRSVAGKETLLKNIYRVEPAQYLKLNISKNKIFFKKYYFVDSQDLDAVDVHEKTANLLSKSITDHLISDVPVGLQLSGGVDSSLIASIATQLKKTHFHTFSIGLKERGWNEFKYSRLVAKKLKTKHHELYFTENDFCKLLPKLTYHLDEPINHPHTIPMYILSKYARKIVKVLISGEGADEIFFGYKRYFDLYKDKNLTVKKIIESNQFSSSQQVKKIFKGDVSKCLDKRKSFIIKQKNLFDKIFNLDMATYLPPLLLRQDKMGMAANVENRVPFLDYELVEFGYSLSLNDKIDNIESKKVLKDIALKVLPKDLVTRPKIGFGLPISEWLKNSKGLGKYLEIFKDEERDKRNFLNYGYIKKIIMEHKVGKADHGQLLWILISLEVWLQIFIDGKSYKKFKF